MDPHLIEEVYKCKVYYQVKLAHCPSIKAFGECSPMGFSLKAV